MKTETKAERIERWERLGLISPTCPSCAEVYATGEIPFGPSHKPREGCESGKRPHCSCDRCFLMAPLTELVDAELKSLRAFYKMWTAGERWCSPQSPPSESLQLFYALTDELIRRRKDRFL